MTLYAITGALIGGSIGGLIGYLGRCTSGACPFTSTPLRGMIFGALFGLFLSISYVCERNVNTAYDKNAIEGGLFIENSADFEKLVVESQQPVIVNFFSPTCPPCRRLAPTIVSLKEKYSGRADVYKVDVTELPEIAEQYGIAEVPTVLFFVGGEEVERVTGNNYESIYTKILDEIFQDEQVLPAQK